MVRHGTLVLLAAVIALTGETHAQRRRPAPGGPATALAAATVTPTPAQPAMKAPTPTVKRLAPPIVVDRIGYEEGIPNGHVIAMVQDQQGFMWLGTQGGLARYDGTRMRVYRPDDADPQSISDSYITALALDATGKVWIGTGEKGVSVYDPSTDKFTRYGAGSKGGLSSPGITAILRDRKDRMWLAMSGGGLNRFDAATSTFVAYQADPLDTVITAIDVDAEGTLWLGTENEGLRRWNPDTGMTSAFPLTDEDGAAAVAITSIHVVDKGKVWAGTDGAGLVVMDPVSLQAIRYRNDPSDPDSLSADHIKALLEDREGAMWIGTLNGLNKIDKAGVIEQYHHDPTDPRGLAVEGIESLLQDEGSVMWVGGFVNGVSRFDPAQASFGRYRTSTQTTNSFYEDTDGSVWIGTFHTGLMRFDWDKRRITTYTTLGAAGTADSLSLETGWIPAVHRDRRGTMWLSIEGQGVVAFDTTTLAYKQYKPDPDDPSSFPVDTVWDILEDADGNVWFASWGGGLVRYDAKTDALTAFTTENVPGLSSNHIYSVVQDPVEAHVLWLAAAKGGLVRFDTKAATATSFRHKDGDPASLSSDDVLCIYRDPKAPVAWAGTYGAGLNRIDLTTGKVQRFTVSNSRLTNDVVFGILPDDDGQLWMSTNGGGLVQFAPEKNTWNTYDVFNGLQGNEFAQNAYMKSRTGRLYFGGSDGFNAFLPKEIKRDTYVPPVALTGFKIYNQDVKLAKPIWTLPAITVSYADSFEVQFAALSYAAPEKTRYAYKLEGVDDTFIETDRPYASYPKLDGGRYTLRVRAANRDGVWNEKGVALTLRVTPPFWRTWAAYVVYLLLLAGLVFLVFYLQRQRVRRVEREGRLAVVERDLALTGAVQTGFLPDPPEANDAHVRLVGFYQGAESCSGDWWWHEKLPGRYAILVGDVTGHGPGPAMVTAAVATAFRVLTENGFADVREALEVLNRVVLQVGKGKYSMTMAALELNEFTGAFTLFSAGAPPIISLGQSGKHRTLFCAGTPLGTAGDFEPGRLDGQLEPADRILLYTDGIPEIMLPSGNALGLRKLGQIFERTAGKQLRDVASEIVASAAQAQGTTPQEDDWTFAVVEWVGPKPGGAFANHDDF